MTATATTIAQNVREDARTAQDLAAAIQANIATLSTDPGDTTRWALEKAASAVRDAATILAATAAWIQDGKPTQEPTA